MQTEREKELAHIENLKKDNPELFESKIKIEDGNFLSKYGIKIENKEELPAGFIKVLSSDFIVEEFDNEGVFHSINKESESDKIDPKHKYISATLVKCNISTIDFENIISKIIPNIKIGYAGIKDKKAITSQKITFKAEFLDLVKNISQPNFFIKNFVSCQSPIGVGNLTSNLFTIAIRFRDFNENDRNLIIKKLEELSKKGFKNYFYLQRFGSPRFIAQELGLHILNGDFKSAVYKNLFKTTENELGYFKKLRTEAENLAPDWNAVQNLYSPFPTTLKTENDLIRELIKNNGDFEKAILGIRDQMQIWVYAFASLLFNYKISNITSNLKVPLPFSTNQKIHKEYEDIFNILRFNPKLFSELRKYNFSIRDNFIDVFCKATDLKYSFSNNSLIVSFKLGKGSYATSLLANIFNEVVGASHKLIDLEIFNIKREIEKNIPSSTDETLEYFKPLISESINK